GHPGQQGEDGLVVQGQGLAGQPQGHDDAGDDGQGQHAEADPDQAEEQGFQGQQRWHGAHGAAHETLLAGRFDGTVQVAVQHGHEHGVQCGDGDQGVGGDGNQQVYTQPFVAGVRHQVAGGEQGGQQTDQCSDGQQQQLQAVQAQQEIFHPEDDHAQAQGGGQGQRPAEIQPIGRQDGGAQADGVQGDGAQQTTAANGPGGTDVAGLGDGPPQGDAQHGVGQCGKQVKYNAD